MSEYRKVSKYLSDDADMMKPVCAINKDETICVIACKKRWLNGEPAYFFHNWVLDDFCQNVLDPKRIEALVIRDVETKKHLAIPLDEAHKKAIRGASGIPGEEWALSIYVLEEGDEKENAEQEAFDFL